MPAKAQKKNHRGLPSVKFSEMGLLVFMVLFAAIGSYLVVNSFAQTEGGVVLNQTAISPQESAWFGSAASAAMIVMAAGPIAAFLIWWIWLRSQLVLWAKVLVTITPILAITAFT